MRSPVERQGERPSAGSRRGHGARVSPPKTGRCGGGLTWTARLRRRAPRRLRVASRLLCRCRVKRTAMILTALLMTQMLWTRQARAGGADAPLPGWTPVDWPTKPTLELSRPRLGARRELMVGLWLSAASVSSIVLGGTLMGAGDRYGSFAG